jgi:transcriptional regulator with XRE-family HTH domain
MNLPEKIRLLRKSLGYNQTDFGNELGLEQAGYGHLESGKTKKISKSVKIILELKFNANTEWLENEDQDISKMIKYNSVVSESKELYSKCKNCNEKQQRIKELEDIIESINKLTTKKQN